MQMKKVVFSDYTFSGPTTDLSLKTFLYNSNSEDFVELEKQMRVQLEAKRQYLVLVEEISGLNITINQNQHLRNQIHKIHKTHQRSKYINRNYTLT